MNLVISGGPFGRPPSFYFGVFLRLVAAFVISLALTGMAGGQTTTLLNHSFDGVTAPDLPVGVVAETAAWKTSSSSSSPGSGLNNLAHTGGTPSSVVLGPIDLSSATAATLTYYARRTSSYPADSLIVRFSIDGGVSFPHVFSSGGLPTEASAYEFVSIALAAPLFGESAVYLQFDGRGGSSGGANIRIDDVSIVAPLDLSSTDASFGFSADSSLWNPDSGPLSVSFDLSWPGPESIQGFQFDLGFDASLFNLDSVTSTHAGLSGAGWQISMNGNRVVVINTSNGTLSPGDYTGLISSEWTYTGSPLAQDSSSTVTIADLLVAESSPSGGTLSLPNGLRSHVITVEANLASITASADSLGFGNVIVGDSTSLSLLISNPTGMADLRLDSVRTGSETFFSATSSAPQGTFYPESFASSVAPASSTTLTLWFRPSTSQYGFLEDNITLYHNAPSGSTVIGLTGIGLGGRGDADGDGQFDIADVIESLDVVSGLVTTSPETLARFDVFPFPSGDSAVDVRDLTVQIQAILRAEWPDASPLPVPDPAFSAGKGGHSYAVLVQNGSTLELNSNAAIRGFQLEFRTETQPSSPLAGKNGLTVSSYFGTAHSVYRTLMFTQPTGALPSGKHVILDNLLVGSEFVSGILITDNKEKQHIYSLGGSSTFIETPSNPTRAEPTVFPNPFSLSTGTQLTLSLPQSSTSDDLELINVLGQVMLSTTLKNDETIHKLDLTGVILSPGIHFFRYQNGNKLEVVPFMVVR